MSTVPRQGFKKKSLVFRKIALEARLPPHNDGAALCLAKIGRAFKINNIQRGRVTYDMDEIQLSRSFGEGQVWGPAASVTRVTSKLARSSRRFAAVESC